MSQVQGAKAKNTKPGKADKNEKPVAKIMKPTVLAPEPIRLSPELVAECRGILLQMKGEILNQVRQMRDDLHTEDKGGDEADQTVRVLAEAEFLNRHERMRNQLMEIESALGRIENGTFGICEETEEAIEPERLRAIPWTRLSIEGAEIRESVNKRFAGAR